MKFGAREVLFLLVMVALLLSAWYFVFRKADEQIATYAADTEQKRLKLTELQAATVRIADINKTIDDLQQRIRAFESKLPRQSDTNTVVREIDQQAHGRRLLEVGSIKAPARGDKAAGYYELPVKIGMRGDFRSFYEFLLELERLPRITRVNQMKLSKINEVNGSMTADMTLSIFFAPDNTSGK
jgi:Tfp pilus assembly protein PilO